MKPDLVDYILVSLAVLTEGGSLFPSQKETWYLAYTGRYPYKKETLHSVICRLAKERWLRKKRLGSGVAVSLTKKGWEFLAEKFPLTRRGLKWDGRWRVVIFDINEKERRQRAVLRQYLKFLGFGQLQESVWLSPFPVEEELRRFLAGKSISGEVLLLKAEISFGDIKELAARVWSLRKLGNAYQRLIGEWWENKVTSDSGFAAKWESEYLRLLLDDPFLPKEFLPYGWAGEKARKIYETEVKICFLASARKDDLDEITTTVRQ